MAKQIQSILTKQDSVCYYDKGISPSYFSDYAEAEEDITTGFIVVNNKDDYTQKWNHVMFRIELDKEKNVYTQFLQSSTRYLAAEVALIQTSSTSSKLPRRSSIIWSTMFL